MKKKTDIIEWHTWSDAFKLFLNGVTLKTCIPVALVVGVILSTINQSDVIFNGSSTNATWIKVGMNFVVPFCVSSYGFLNARRSENPVSRLQDGF